MMLKGMVSSADQLSLPFVVGLVGEAGAACWLGQQQSRAFEMVV